MARVSIYNLNGYWVGDLRAETEREYVLNANPQPGRADFRVARFDPKNTIKYLEFGNYVLIRDNPYPDWIGVIVNRKWNHGNMEVLALQAEYVLFKRRTKIGIIKGTAGSLFRQIINMTNAEKYNEKKITLGAVFTGGQAREETLGKRALEHIREIAERSGNDFDITYALDGNGRLSLVGNWYKRKGIYTNKYLREGHNIALVNNLMEEDARVLVNSLEGRGDASTNDTRISVMKYDQASIAQYGLNQDSEVFDGNKESATVTRNTVSRLASLGQPPRAYNVNVLDVGDILDYMEVGNSHNLDFNTAGYEEDGFGAHDIVRAVGMGVSDIPRVCELNLESE